MLNNSVSVSVSDDDSEDSSTRMRSRVRRKRRKPFLRSRPDFTRKILTTLIQWWPALVLLIAIALLVYEAVKIGGSERRSPPRVNKYENAASRSSGIKSHGNLNRLDPSTRVVAGVRERCLKLLPPEELALLEIPNDEDSKIPLKDLVYAMETDRASEDGKFNLSTVYLEGARFNIFTGNQTLEDREQSFKVAERAEVHCGFYTERGGFRISDEDKSYMKTCKVVVSTCAFGGGDDLYQPIGMLETSLQKVCYVAFWDEITLATQEAEGNKFDDSHFIGNWRIIIVRDLPFRDQRLNGKIPKMLPHRLFPNARYSIWVDSKSQFRRDPLGVLEALLWRSNFELAISEHGARSSVYDEAKAVVKKNKATPDEVEVQLTQYRQDGLPEDKRFNGKKALAEASIIVRKHTPMTNLFMCLWFNEVVRFTSRDQLSFPYVLWRLQGLLNRINMFPVCTRKDLVNSMGHIRKVLKGQDSPKKDHDCFTDWTSHFGNFIPDSVRTLSPLLKIISNISKEVMEVKVECKTHPRFVCFTNCTLKRRGVCRL